MTIIVTWNKLGGVWVDDILQINGLNKVFYSGGHPISAVSDVSFEITQSECFGLVGESGSGKSTVAKIIGGLLTPSSGNVTFLGRQLHYSRPHAIAQREGMQMIFQNPYSSFSPKMTIFQALMEPLVYRQRHSTFAAYDMIVSALNDVGLGSDYEHRRCYELSGGECQRAAIAQALLCSPKMLICDEITSALDVSVQAQIVNLLMRLKNKRKLSILFISHDIALVSCICNRIAIMKGGEIVEIGDTERIITTPQNAYTNTLLRFYKDDAEDLRTSGN